MMHLHRREQPDLMLAKTKLRLVTNEIPDDQRDAAIDILAGLVVVGVVYTFVLMVWAIGRVWK